MGPEFSRLAGTFEQLRQEYNRLPRVKEYARVRWEVGEYDYAAPIPAPLAEEEARWIAAARKAAAEAGEVLRSVRRNSVPALAYWDDSTSVEVSYPFMFPVTESVEPGHVRFRAKLNAASYTCDLETDQLWYSLTAQSSLQGLFLAKWLGERQLAQDWHKEATELLQRSLREAGPSVPRVDPDPASAIFKVTRADSLPPILFCEVSICCCRMLEALFTEQVKLTRSEAAILKVVAKSPTTMIIADIQSALSPQEDDLEAGTERDDEYDEDEDYGPSMKTVKTKVKRLLGYGLLHRPQGERNGVALTPYAREHLIQLAGR